METIFIALSNMSGIACTSDRETVLPSSTVRVGITTKVEN